MSILITHNCPQCTTTWTDGSPARQKCPGCGNEKTETKEAL